MIFTVVSDTELYFLRSILSLYRTQNYIFMIFTVAVSDTELYFHDFYCRCIGLRTIFFMIFTVPVSDSELYFYDLYCRCIGHRTIFLWSLLSLYRTQNYIFCDLYCRCIGHKTIFLMIFTVAVSDTELYFLSGWKAFWAKVWGSAITLCRTPLDEWSARRRDLYLTTHNTDKGHNHAPGGIRTRSHRKWAAVDPRLRPRCQ
jgi:hypothetical protein